MHRQGGETWRAGTWCHVICAQCHFKSMCLIVGTIMNYTAVQSLLDSTTVLRVLTKSFGWLDTKTDSFWLFCLLQKHLEVTTTGVWLLQLRGFWRWSQLVVFNSYHDYFTFLMWLLVIITPLISLWVETIAATVGEAILSRGTTEDCTGKTTEWRVKR